VSLEVMAPIVQQLQLIYQSLPPTYISLLTLFGIFKVVQFLFTFLTGFWRHFLRPSRNLKKLGQWAVVTGSTDGIGQAVAEELARKGLNIVLVSRTQSKLDEVAGTIEQKYKVETKTVAIDFSKATPTLLEPLKKAVAELDVGVLVNNVGASYDHAEYFTDLTQEKIDQLIRINVDGTTNVTKLILPGMVERKRGAVVNVSSASSLVCEPLYAVYSGTKAYINNFSQALYCECKSKRVSVQCSIPAFVTSKLSKIRHASFFTPNPRTYARSMVGQIGHDSLVMPYWPHALQFFFILSLPGSILSSVLLSRGLDIRRRALKKKEETKKE
jgi:17beta-estradiol 17-dehydrogenase / very-long-chain 3-oxoacyl-CoA reductase